jgi:hypothetical protein
MNIKETKLKAMDEYHYFDTKSNLQFDGEMSQASYDITNATSIEEINGIRMYMAQSYFEAISQIIEENLDSFILSTEVKEYNDELMKLGSKSDKIFLHIKAPTEKDIENAKELFDEIFLLYQKIQKNEKNIIRQERKQFYGKIAPTWVGIFSAGWIALIGLLLAFNVIFFSTLNIIWIIGGWIVLCFLVVVILRLILYKKNN